MLDSSSVYKSIVRQFPNPQTWVGDLSASFAIVDIESTGFVIDKNKIVQVGIGFVENGLFDENSFTAITIKTPYDPVVWGAIYLQESFQRMMQSYGVPITESLKSKIDDNSGSIMGIHEIPIEIQEHVKHDGSPVFASASDVTGITSDFTMKNGIPRSEAVKMLYEFFVDLFKYNKVLVGHNHCRFDIPRLCYEILSQSGHNFEINPNLILDTGMIVKAALCKAKPEKYETPYAFYLRASNIRSYAKWALDRVCVPEFELDVKYGVDTSKQHADASYDCFVNACLVKEMASQCLLKTN